MEAPSHPQVVVVGEEFEAGQAGNAEIDAMLGFDTVLCGDRALRFAGQYQLAPNYCDDMALTVPELEKLGIYPLVSVTTYAGKRKPKSFERGYVAVFPFGDVVALTKPLKTESEALACALWFALADK